MQYFFNEQRNYVLIKLENGSEIHIPIDERNTDYQQYLAWVEEGNTPEPYEIGDDN